MNVWEQKLIHKFAGFQSSKHYEVNDACAQPRVANACKNCLLTLKVLVATIDVQWEGMGDVGSARYELALLPPCPTIRVLSYSN